MKTFYILTVNVFFRESGGKKSHHQSLQSLPANVHWTAATIMVDAALNRNTVPGSTILGFKRCWVSRVNRQRTNQTKKHVDVEGKLIVDHIPGYRSPSPKRRTAKKKAMRRVTVATCWKSVEKNIQDIQSNQRNSSSERAARAPRNRCVERHKSSTGPDTDSALKATAFDVPKCGFPKFQHFGRHFPI